MKALFVLLLLPIVLTSGCSGKKSTALQNVDEQTVESIPPVEKEYKLPHILMFGDEEGATIVSSEFVEEQTYKIKESLLSEYTQEEIDDIDVDNQIGGLIREKLYEAVNTELATASASEIAKVDNDEPKALKGLIPRRKMSETKTVQDGLARTTNASMPLSPNTVSAQNIKNAVKNIQSEFNTDDVKITGETGIQFKIWRKIQDFQKHIQNFKKSDFAYFSKAIK